MTLRNISSILMPALILLAILGSCQRSSNNETETRANDEAQIREIERDWAETAVTGDTSVIKRILADDFLGTSPKGALYTKPDFIYDMMSQPSAFTSNILNDVRVRFFGDVAVAQGNETFTLKNGEVARFVWTDVLVQREGKWQIIAAQDLIAPAVAEASDDGLFIRSEEGDWAAIDSCRNEYVTAWLAADADHLADVYTDDAAVLYPNQPAVNGRAAIQSYFRYFFNQYTAERFELHSEEVKIAGNWAFDRGTYKWKARPRKGGGSLEDHGKFLVILQRQANNSWKVARDMDNSDRPLSQTTRGSN